MTDSREDRLAHLRELLSKAIPGRWEANDVPRAENVGIFGQNGVSWMGKFVNHDNAKLVVAAVNALPELLAELEFVTDQGCEECDRMIEDRHDDGTPFTWWLCGECANKRAVETSDKIKELQAEVTDSREDRGEANGGSVECGGGPKVRYRAVTELREDRLILIERGASREVLALLLAIFTSQSGGDWYHEIRDGAILSRHWKSLG